MFTVRIDRTNPARHDVYECDRYSATQARDGRRWLIDLCTGAFRAQFQIDPVIGEAAFFMNEEGQTIDSIRPNGTPAIFRQAATK